MFRIFLSIPPPPRVFGEATQRHLHSNDTPSAATRRVRPPAHQAVRRTVAVPLCQKLSQGHFGSLGNFLEHTAYDPVFGEHCDQCVKDIGCTGKLSFVTICLYLCECSGSPPMCWHRKVHRADASAGRTWPRRGTNTPVPNGASRLANPIRECQKGRTREEESRIEGNIDSHTKRHISTTYARGLCQVDSIIIHDTNTLYYEGMVSKGPLKRGSLLVPSCSICIFCSSPAATLSSRLPLSIWRVPKIEFGSVPRGCDD